MLLESIDTRNREVQLTIARLNGGYLRVYGAPRPAAPEVAVSVQLLMAELRFPSPAFGNPVNGVALANVLAAVAILAAGAPTWFRALEVDGTTVVLDGDIGQDLILDSPILASGGSFSVTSLAYQRP